MQDIYDFELAEERRLCSLGAARVGLIHLTFENECQPGVRTVTRENIKWLINKFGTDKCRRDEPRHWIPAVVSPEEFQAILRCNSMTSLPSPPAVVRLGVEWKVKCLQGRVRMHAGLEWLPPDGRWWTIHFYDSNRLSANGRRSLSEYSEASQEFLSGQVYRSAQLYLRRGDRDAAQSWFARLPKTVYRDYKRLQKRSERGSVYHRSLLEALDALLDYPGLWSTWVNFHRSAFLLCPQLIVNCLRGIRDDYSRITGGRSHILDSYTVKLLEGRSPSQSIADRDFIRRMFEENLAFSMVTDSDDRQAICQRVNESPGIISSLYVLHENLKYLEPVDRVVRTLLPPRYEGTTEEGLRELYMPVDGTGREEPEQGFWSAYRQVYLAAMRNFFGFLPGVRLRGMHRSPEDCQPPHPAILRDRLIRVAQSVRFRVVAPWGSLPASGDSDRTITERENEHTGNTPASSTPPALVTNEPQEWSIKSRCGMTDVSSHLSDQNYLFLPYIYGPADPSTGVSLTSFAVKREIFLSFFPPFPGVLVHTAPNNTHSAEAAARVSPVPSIHGAEDVAEASIARGMNIERSLDNGSELFPPPASSPNHIPTMINESAGGSASEGETMRVAGGTEARLSRPIISDESEILEFNPTWCKIRTSVSPGGFVKRFLAKPMSHEQYGCIFDLSTGNVVCILSSHADSFQDAIQLTTHWFADITPSNVLSIIPVARIGSRIRNGAVIFAGERGTVEFNQQILHPDIHEAVIPGLQLPNFDRVTNTWYLSDEVDRRETH